VPGRAASDLTERSAAAAQVFVDDLSRRSVSTEDHRHLARALRLRDGEAVVACDGRGGWQMCRFRTRPEDPLEPDGPCRRDPAPTPELAVAVTPVKGERTEWTLQKLTELGVDQVVLLRADRSVVRWDPIRGQRVLERLRKVAREAAAQSRRTWLPEVTGPLVPADLLAHHHRWCLADLEGPGPSRSTTALAVGPEGGWSAEERALPLARVALGPQVLRAETAAVVAGALLGALRAGTVAPAGEHRAARSGPTSPSGAREA